MCSSPKGHRPTGSHPVFSHQPLSQDALMRFSQCANAADERRQRRKALATKQAKIKVIKQATPPLKTRQAAYSLYDYLFICPLPVLLKRLFQTN